MNTTKTRYFCGSPGPIPFVTLIRQLGDGTFARPTRSSIPVLAFWKRAIAFEEVCRELQIDPHGPTQICFEYPVPSADTRSKSSFTDVMCLTDDYAVAVEGKWTEPRYERVARWQTKGSAEHRKIVLQHWLACIEPFACDKPGVDAVSQAIYQMVHRTASACVAAGSKRTACVVYQCFGESDEPKHRVESDLKLWKKIIRPSERLRFFVLDVRLKRTGRFQELNTYNRACCGRADFANQLRDELVADSLFEFVSSVGCEV